MSDGKINFAEEAKQKRREYDRKWREQNKDKVRAYAKNWNEKNKDKVREYQRQLRLDNLDEYRKKTSAAVGKWQKNNRELYNARIRACYHKRKERENKIRELYESEETRLTVQVIENILTTSPIQVEQFHNGSLPLAYFVNRAMRSSKVSMDSETVTKLFVYALQHTK